MTSKPIIKIISTLMIVTLLVGIIFWSTDSFGKDDKSKGNAGANIDRTSVIFTADSYNWGCNDASSDYWTGSSWTVHCDGTVEYYESYNLSGNTEVVTWKLSDEDLTRLNRLLDGGFKLCIKGADACDGTGWSMASYDGTLEKTHEFNGYIYGNPVLEEMVEIIYLEER